MQCGYGIEAVPVFWILNWIIPANQLFKNEKLSKYR